MSSFPFVLLCRDLCFIYVICIYLRILLSNTISILDDAGIVQQQDDGCHLWNRSSCVYPVVASVFTSGLEQIIVCLFVPFLLFFVFVLTVLRYTASSYYFAIFIFILIKFSTKEWNRCKDVGKQ